MSWLPQFLAPLWAWLFLLLIPLIVVYFLKLRRQRLEVSSLALWRQVINDQRVNAPFQKFKRNLLLLLQLLLLCCLVLAAMQPFLPGDAEEAQYLPVLIDCSASMGAIDSEGKSRLDLAREEIKAIVDGLLPGQQLTLIAVGNTARRLTEFTDNKPVLYNALEQLEVEDVPSRIEEGLRLAQALSRTQRITRVRFYSDGNLPMRKNPSTGQMMALVDIDLPFQIDFFQIPQVDQNIAITDLNARRGSLDRWDIFLRVANAGETAAESQLILTADGETIGEENLILAPDATQRLVFPVSSEKAQFVEARLNPVSGDALEADNRAWLNLPAGRPLDVFCSGELVPFQHALTAMDGVTLLSAEEAEQRESVDLILTEKPSDSLPEAAVSVVVGPIPGELQDLLASEQTSTEVIDWRRDAPLLQHVELKDVLISERTIKQGDADDTAFEKLGYEILAHGTGGPLILRRRADAEVRYNFLFDLGKSTLPYRVAFPVLVSNLVGESLRQASLGDVNALKTGVLPALTLSPETTYRITNPTGEHEERKSDEAGTLAGIGALKTGEYEVRSGGSRVEHLGASLLNPEESSLATVDKISFNEVSVAAHEERFQQDKPLWNQLALLAFGLLLGEWWFFQKRPGGLSAS